MGIDKDECESAVAFSGSMDGLNTDALVSKSSEGLIAIVIATNTRNEIDLRSCAHSGDRLIRSFAARMDLQGPSHHGGAWTRQGRGGNDEICVGAPDNDDSTTAKEACLILSEGEGGCGHWAMKAWTLDDNKPCVGATQEKGRAECELCAACVGDRLNGMQSQTYGAGITRQ